MVLNKIYIEADNEDNATAKTIYKIKDQAPKSLNLNGFADIRGAKCYSMTILALIQESHEFKAYMNEYLTDAQYQLFLTLTFDDFDTLMSSDYILTAPKTHDLLYKYTQQLIEICHTVDNDVIDYFISRNVTTHEFKHALEDELNTNRDLLIIKMTFLKFIQAICSWK